MIRNGNEVIYARLPKGEGEGVRISDLPRNDWPIGTDNKRGAATWRQQPYTRPECRLWQCHRSISYGKPTERWSRPRRLSWWQALWTV